MAELKKGVMLVVAMLAGHGVFDIKHYRLLTNPNLPVWLAALWIAFDILKTAFRTWRAAKANADTKELGFRLQGVQCA